MKSVIGAGRESRGALLDRGGHAFRKQPLEDSSRISPRIASDDSRARVPLREPGMRPACIARVIAEDFRLPRPDLDLERGPGRRFLLGAQHHHRSGSYCDWEPDLIARSQRARSSEPSGGVGRGPIDGHGERHRRGHVETAEAEHGVGNDGSRDPAAIPGRDEPHRGALRGSPPSRYFPVCRAAGGEAPRRPRRWAPPRTFP